jgi:periplasmic mercuric ion binding protein
MKLNILFIAILVLLIGANIGLKANSSVTLKFVTSGNCYTCELRIEAAVRELAGIDSVSWDAEAKVTTVKFDTTKMDIRTIMKKIASVGHDTEWYKGDDFVYNYKLVGTCCEYLRTLKYDDVKIGYLSLMNQWVSVNSEPINKITLYSLNSNNLIYNISGYENTPISLNIYSISGAVVYSNSSINPSGEIDLSYIPTGTYIVTMSNQNKTIFVQKIIK